MVIVILSRFRSRLLCLLCMSLTTFWFGCGGSGNNGNTTPSAPHLVSISISPSSASLPLGTGKQLSATGTNSDGSTNDLTAVVSWSSAATSIATINSSGLVSSVAQGGATIKATMGGVSGAASITVGPPSLTGLSIAPSSSSLPLGTGKQLTATGTYTDGSSNDITTLVTWSSTAASIATVSSSGLVSSLAQGAATISATMGTISAAASIAVLPPQLSGLSITPAQASIYIGAASQKFSAIGTYTDNSTADLSNSVTWSVGNPRVSQVDTQGNATSIRSGYSTISAVTSALSSSAGLAVLAYPRYMVYTNLADRTLSRSTMDASTGQLRLIGYQLTGANNYSSGDCATTDPDGQYLYVAHVVNSTVQSDPAGQAEIYRIDSSTGGLAPLTGSPFPLSAPVGCIQFEPSGHFGYATASLNNTNNQLVTFSRDPGTGLLTSVGSISLPNAAFGVAMDPLGVYLYIATEYFGSNAPSEAFGYTIDPTTGSLTPIAGTPFQLSIYSGSFAFHPSGNFIYMSNTNGTSIDAYAVDRSTGKISAVSGGSLSTCVNPSQLIFAPDSTHAYAVCSMDTNHDAHSASLASFAVAASGQLSLIGSAATGDAPQLPVVDPSGQFVYVPALSDYIDAFKIGSNGVATATQRFGARNQVGSMLALGGAAPVHYVSLNAYVTTTGDNQISNYPITSTGGWDVAAQTFTTFSNPFSLSLIPGGVDMFSSSSIPQPNVQHYLVDPNTGAFNYDTYLLPTAAISGGFISDLSGLYAFQSDPLAPKVYNYRNLSGHWLMQSYISSQPGAGPMALDPTSRFLFVANQVANSISVFQYWGTSSLLTEMSGSWTAPYADGSPYPLAASPQALVAGPIGDFLYVISNDQTLRAYAIDYRAGAHLKQVSSLNLGAQPLGVAVEPSGKYIYVATASGLSAFTGDPNSGALSPVALNPPVAIPNSNGVYVEPSGKYLYLTSSTSNAGAVYGYTIGADGNLSAVAGNPIAAPNQPSSLAFRTSIN